MDNTPLKRQITSALCKRAGRGADDIENTSGGPSDAGIAGDTPLFEGGLELDSVGFLEAVLEVERISGTRLRSEQLTEEVLATVDSFADHVIDGQSNAGSAAGEQRRR